MSETAAGLSALPDGWVWTTLEEVSELNPRINKQSINDDLEVTFLPMKRVEELSGKIDLSETKQFSELKRKSYTPFRDGDILFAKVTPCMENGKIAIARDLKNGIGFGSTEFHVIRLLDKQSRQFFFFYFLQQKFRQEAKRAMTSGVGLLRVPTNYMRKVRLPLPPLLEQQAIVVKIEELFTKLDAGINALHKAQSQLKRYRQSVLKAAFEGKLTEAWRVEHQEEIEPAFVLLECILKERREKWEAKQLEQIKAKEKMPKNDKWKTKYKEPVVSDTSNLPELPKRWTWATLEEVSELNPRIDKQSIDDDLEVTFLPMKRVEELSGKIDLSETKRFSELKKKSYTPFQDGDVLFAKVTPCMENGKIAIAYDLKNGIGFGSTEFHVIRLWEEQSRQFFFFYFLQQKFRQEAKRAMTGAVGLLRVPTDYMRKIPIPLPPLPEQQAIVSEVESRLSVADEVEKTITVELKRAEQLRQSILKKAFSGKLVPQDPNDEPASLLLERIKAEKSQHTQGQLRLKLV